MNLVKYELYKLFKGRGAFLALLCLLNILALLVYKNSANSELNIPEKYINELESKLSVLSLAEINDYVNTQYDILSYGLQDFDLIPSISENLEITDNYFMEYYLFRHFKNEINKLTDYNGYLDEIINRADVLENISLFSDPDTFSFRNIQKTADKYKQLRGIYLSYDKSDGVKKATQSTFTDLFAVLAIFFVCTQLITSEKDIKIVALQRTTKNGRLHLILSKLLTLTIANVVIFIIFYGVNYVTGLIIGYGDLTRAVQSVRGFYSSPFSINVMEYLVYYGLIKIAVIFVLSLFMLLCTILLKNVLTIYITIIGFFGLSYLTYLLIPYSSVFSPFKYINFIYYLQSDKLLYEYVNINFFGYPINCFSCFIIVISLIFALFLSLTIRIYCVQINFALQRLTFNVKSKGSLNIFYHEARKILLNNNVLLFLLLIIFLNGWWTLSQKTDKSPHEIHYKNYMMIVNGEYTPEKYDYIQEEYNHLITSNNPLSDNSTKLMALEQVKENAEYLKSRYEMGETYYFVYERGYDKLTAGIDNNRDAVLTLVLLIALILLLSGLISTEHQSKVIKIINTCPKGRNELLRVKYLVSLIISFLVYFFIYSIEYYFVYKNYGFDLITAPTASFKHLEMFGNLSILLYLIIINVVRLLGISVFILAIMQISRKTNIMTISVAAFMFLLPVLLIIIGFPIAGILPIISLLSANVVFQSSVIFHVVITIILLLIIYLLKRVMK